MKYLIITAFFPPQNSSAAVQINDLANEFIKQGHVINLFIADDNINKNIKLEKRGSLLLIRFKVLKITNINFFKRLINEFLMPFQMIIYSIFYRLKINSFDGIIWYSPSAFFSPLIIYLKLFNKCKTYLILRDIFPRWLKDLDLIRSRLIYLILEFYANLQFLAADIIGVQSKGNLKFIPKKIFFKSNKVTVLNNWLSQIKNEKCKLNLSNPKFKGRRIVIYSGNMGISQGMQTLIELANSMKNNNIVFLFIGRGTEYLKSKNMCKEIDLQNVVFENEIPSSQIFDLYSKCLCGLIVLDKKHKTHNIPGKFLSYLLAGLPVFAIVNEKNDLIKLVNEKKVGFATDTFDINEVHINFIKLLNNIEKDYQIKDRCKELANTLFSTSKIVKEIINDLK
tara:strand:+ start:566 stop:1750 length:1185 start_codon:yes stop_codon:yes gene_type:complete